MFILLVLLWYFAFVLELVSTNSGRGKSSLPDKDILAQKINISISKQLKQNIAFEKRRKFKHKKTPKPLIFQEFRRPCQVVEVTGFEPTTSASRTQRSTKLSHTSSTASDIIHRIYWLVNRKIEKIQKISKRIEINQVLFGERQLN